MTFKKMNILRGSKATVAMKQEQDATKKKRTFRNQEALVLAILP